MYPSHAKRGSWRLLSFIPCIYTECLLSPFVLGPMDTTMNQYTGCRRLYSVEEAEDKQVNKWGIFRECYTGVPKQKKKPKMERNWSH